MTNPPHKILMTQLKPTIGKNDKQIQKVFSFWRTLYEPDPVWIFLHSLQEAKRRHSLIWLVDGHNEEYGCRQTAAVCFRSSEKHLLSDHWRDTETRSNLPLKQTRLLSKMKRHRSASRLTTSPSAATRYNPSLMTAILWIVTIFACAGQPSPFSGSMARQWRLFVLFRFFVTFATRLSTQWPAVLWLSQRSHCTEWTSIWASCSVYRRADSRLFSPFDTSVNMQAVRLRPESQWLEKGKKGFKFEKNNTFFFFSFPWAGAKKKITLILPICSSLRGFWVVLS